MRVAICVLAMSTLARVLLNAQAPGSGAFHSGVSLVHIDAEATDANHRVLNGLKKEDFLILDNGRPQPILSMGSEEQAVDLVLLFDTSLSMRGAVQRIADGAEQAFGELRKGDRVSVMVFNLRSSVLLPMTEDLRTAQTVVQRVLVAQQFGGGTAIQTAVSEAAQGLRSENRTGCRRAILVVTDNVGIRTRREESVVRELWDADASLNGLIVRDPGFAAEHNMTTILAPETLLLQAGMKGIAEKTGGDVLNSSDGSEAFREMIHRIRSRLSLYYRMPDAKHGQARHVKVEFSPEAEKRYPGAVLRARRGYMVP